MIFTRPHIRKALRISCANGVKAGLTITLIRQMGRTGLIEQMGNVAQIFLAAALKTFGQKNGATHFWRRHMEIVKKCFLAHCLI